MNLGIPVGTDDEYVKAEGKRTIQWHDERLQRIITMAGNAGTETKSCGRKMGKQCARHALKFSANARNVHMLRSVSCRLEEEEALLHDTGIMNTFAVVYKQAQRPQTGTRCCEVPEADIQPHFLKVKNRIHVALPTYHLRISQRHLRISTVILRRQRYGVEVRRCENRWATDPLETFCTPNLASSGGAAEHQIPFYHPAKSWPVTYM